MCVQPTRQIVICWIYTTSHPLPLLLEKGRNLTMTSHQSDIETSAVVSNKIAWFVAIARCQYIGSQYRTMAKQATLQER